MGVDRQFYIGVKALVTDRRGRILVLRKVPRKASDRWKPFWDLPGGKMQEHSVEDTLLREIYEEIGVRKVRVGRLIGATVSNFKIDGGRSSLLFLIYKCRVSEGSELRLSKEHDELRWVSAREAKRYLAYMLPEEFLKKLVIAK